MYDDLSSLSLDKSADPSRLPHIVHVPESSVNTLSHAPLMASSTAHSLPMDTASHGDDGSEETWDQAVDNHIKKSLASSDVKV